MIADYSHGDEAVLPINDTNLEHAFTWGNYVDVSTNNEVRVEEEAIAKYGLFLFKDRHSNDANYSRDEISYNDNSVEYNASTITTYYDGITVEWEGQFSIAPSLSTVYLQIYNRTSGDWETLDSNNSANADVDFFLNGVKTSNLVNYYDVNYWVAWRVYQEKI